MQCMLVLQELRTPLVLHQVREALVRSYSQHTRDLHKLAGVVRPALAVLLGLPQDGPRGLALAAARGLWGGQRCMKGRSRNRP